MLDVELLWTACYARTEKDTTCDPVGWLTVQHTRPQILRAMTEGCEHVAPLLWQVGQRL